MVESEREAGAILHENIKDFSMSVVGEMVVVFVGRKDKKKHEFMQSHHVREKGSLFVF